MKAGLSVSEAAAMLGCGKDLLYRNVNRETASIDVGWTKLNLIVIGQRIIVPRAEVERALGLQQESA